MNPCAAITKKQTACRRQALSDSDFCLLHDPEQEAVRQAARRRGGHNRSTAARLGKTLPPEIKVIYDRLQAALEEVASGQLPAARAQAMASVARALLACLAEGETAQRLEKIEGLLRGKKEGAAMYRGRVRTLEKQVERESEKTENRVNYGLGAIELDPEYDVFASPDAPDAAPPAAPALNYGLWAIEVDTE